MENNSQKLSILEKCAYGVGDMACNLFWGLIVFASIFYTDYFGIAPAAAGTMMLIVRCLDISFDVIIGAYADRTKTKYGRFRPWILYGVVPFCVIGFFTFFTPEFSEPLKLVYAYVTFLLFMLMYSVVNVPYGALLGVISADPDERTSASAYRNVGAQIGCLIVYGTLWTTIGYFHGQGHSSQTSFSIVVGIYAAVVLISMLFTFFFTRERVEPVVEQKNKLSDDIKDLVSNKQWIALTVAGIMLLIFVFVHNGLIAFYAKYFVATATGPDTFEVTGTLFGFNTTWELFLTLLTSISAIITIIGTIAIKPVVSKFGKKYTWIGCFAFASILSVLFYFVPKESLGTIVLLQTLFTLCIGPSSFIMWSMYADVADYAEIKNGRRATGLIYSSATMAQKLGNTLANSLPLFALGAVGFVAAGQDSWLINSSEEIRNAVLMLFSFFPLVGSVIGIIALSFYDIDYKTVAENSAKLAALKAEQEKNK